MKQKGIARTHAPFLSLSFSHSLSLVFDRLYTRTHTHVCVCVCVCIGTKVTLIIVNITQYLSQLTFISQIESNIVYALLHLPFTHTHTHTYIYIHTHTHTYIYIYRYYYFTVITGDFHWSSSDSKTLQSILTHLRRGRNSLRFIIPSTLFSKIFGIVPSVPTMTGKTATFILHIFLNSLARFWYFSRVECSSMVRETCVQSQFVSYQSLWKWYLITPCLTLSNIRYVSKVRWSNPGKGVTPSTTSRCRSY